MTDWILSTEVRQPADFHTRGVTIVYRIAKAFTFQAAHQLHGLPDGHQCGRMHGHSYTAEVWLCSELLDVTGFVVDFAELRPVAAYLDQVADHRTLNDLIPQPTSELLARHLYQWTANNIVLPDGVRVEKVRISETAKSWAEYTPTTTELLP